MINIKITSFEDAINKLIELNKEDNTNFGYELGYEIGLKTAFPCTLR